LRGCSIMNLLDRGYWINGRYRTETNDTTKYRSVKEK
jgi:hypothetical protein